MNNTVGMAQRPKMLAFAAVTASALAAAAVGSVPTANATCASFFGIGSGGQCTSTLTSIAIAFGTNAEAHADGLLGAALTLGNSSSAYTVAGALANLAITTGDSNMTSAGGLGSVAFVASGINQSVIAGSGGITDGNIGNIAVSLASPEATETSATGIANLSLNLAGAGRVVGDGIGLTTANVVGLGADLSNGGTLNVVANVSGLNNQISNLRNSGGIGNLAFNFIGSDNVVETDGILAVAGAIGSTGQTVVQSGPGINISFGRSSAASAATRDVRPAAAAAADPDTKTVRKARSAQGNASRTSR